MRVHPVAVVFDFVEPLVAIRRRVDQLRELRRDPLRERGRIGAPPPRYGERRGSGMRRLPGRRIRLLELVPSPTYLAACASSKRMPLQCRLVGKRRPLIAVTSCGMSACAGSW